MSYWTKECQFKIKYKAFTFHYDTATELGEMVRESGCGMPNPYEPGFIEFDEFNEAKWGEM